MNWKQRTPDVRTVILAFIALMAVTSVIGGGFAGMAVAQQTQQADLTVEQPRHVSEPVDTISENGSRVYVARGKHLEIEPNNFNQSDVTDYSVQESEGILSYDKSDSDYILNTQGNTGTYHLSWTVSENNSTAVYTAAIQVPTAGYAHIEQNQYSQLKEDAERGDDLTSRFESAGDPDEPVEQKVDFAVQVINFTNNPFSVLTGQFMAIQTLRFMTPAGWIDLGLTVLLVYGLTRGLYSTIARLRKQLEKEEKVRRREDVQYIKMYKQNLAGQMMTDVDGIDEHQAAVLEKSLGTNLFTALRNFWSTWGADSLKKMYVDAMGSVGYRARVHRSLSGEFQSMEILEPDSREPMTDGGEDTDNSPVELEMETKSDVVNLSNAPGDVLDAMTWEHVDDRVFQKNPDISAVDHLMVANRERSGDLIGEMNISIPEDFQSRKEFMEALGRFIAHVQETDFTDEENYPREDKTVLNHLMAFTTTMDDEYNVPLDLWWRACVWNAEGLDRDDEAKSVLADITDAGHTMDDVDMNGSGGGPSGAD